MNTLCLVLSHNYVITINQYLNQCLHLVLFACILSDEKARKTFYKKVAMCSDGGEWRDNFHFSSNNFFFCWSRPLPGPGLVSTCMVPVVVHAIITGGRESYNGVARLSGTCTWYESGSRTTPWYE